MKRHKFHEMRLTWADECPIEDEKIVHYAEYSARGTESRSQELKIRKGMDIRSLGRLRGPDNHG